MQKAFCGKLEQQREHKPLNTELFLSFALHPFFVVWLSDHSACSAISAVLRGHSFLRLLPCLSLAHFCFVDDIVSAQQCKLAW